MIEETMPAQWLAMSVQILDDEKVEVLIEDHGHEAFTILIALLCQAAVQKRGGVVERTFKRLAADAHTSREKTKEVIMAADEVDFIDIIAASDRGFEASIKQWAKWQQNFRKAKSRANKNPNVTGRHEEVTTPSLNRTEQNKTEHNKTEHNRTEPSGSSPAAAPLSDLLANLIAENTGRRPRPGKRWADAERLLFSRDGRDPVEAERLLRWSQQDEFWRSNILSLPKFRQHYDQLLLQARRTAKAGSPGMTQAEERAAAIRRKRQERAAA